MSSTSSAVTASKKRERTEEEPEIIDVSKRAKTAEHQAPSSSAPAYAHAQGQHSNQQYAQQHSVNYANQGYASQAQSGAAPYNYAYPANYGQYDYHAAAWAQYYAQNPQAAWAAYGAAEVPVAPSTDPSVDPLAYPGEKPTSSEDKEKEAENKNVRYAAGRVWEDTSMSEWPDNDFRIHVGNLGPEVDDKALHDAFKPFPTLAHWRVVRDKRYETSKGYGFVSFLDPREGVKALKAMNGKYIGSRPIKATKSTHEKRAYEGPSNGKKR